MQKFPVRCMSFLQGIIFPKQKQNSAADRGNRHVYLESITPKPGSKYIFSIDAMFTEAELLYLTSAWLPPGFPCFS